VALAPGARGRAPSSLGGAQVMSLDALPSEESTRRVYVPGATAAAAAAAASGRPTSTSAVAVAVTVGRCRLTPG
jgi:hypothetical protein